MRVVPTLRFILSHPLNAGQPVAAIGRFVGWQLRSRLRREVTHEWVGGAKLVVRRGMRGATGNVYCGLHEFVDMAFVLHFLRAGDLFVDVGANVGSYTILAASRGARCISVEPDPESMRALRRNVAANGAGDRVETVEVALGAEAGEVRFTTGRDTVNRVASHEDATARTVAMKTLDALTEGRSPALVKLDVERHEAAVLDGAAATLAKESLLGVISELADLAVEAALARHGFRPCHYDPVAREISESKPAFRSQNTLFLRNLGAVTERVRTAPSLRIHGKEV